MARPSVRRLLSVIALCAVASAAGAAAASLVADSAVGSLVSSMISTTPVPARPAAAVNATRVSESVRASASIYRKRAGASPLDRALLPSDQSGAAVVLTSDGWIALPSSLLSGSLLAVFADHSSAPLDLSKAIRDEATGIAFLKLDASRLQVASFDDGAALHASDPIFLADSESVVTASVVSPLRLPVAAKADYVESSERLGRRIAIDRPGLPGAAAVDAGGLTVGIAMGDGTAVPISFVEEAMRSVFRNGTAARPKLGVRFVSLDSLPNAKDAGFGATGALITAGGSGRAIAKGSAAEEAGLKEGDMILAVEHDRIDGEVTLAERLQDYQPGATVELTVLRDGAQTKARARLK